jgi:RNA polymerase sigma-70 factor
LGLEFLSSLPMPSLPSPELGPALTSALAAGRARWPSIELDPARFVRHLAARASDEAQLAQLNVADLYLTCACEAGTPRALECFEHALLGKVPAFVARYDSSHGFVDEVKQVLRVKLFTGAAPKIAQYTGRGSLESWLCAVAIRAAISLQRKAGGAAAPPSEDNAVDEMAAPVDPELRLLQDQYRAEFQQATRDAIAGLSPRERNLLRFYYVERLTLDKLGALYRVHATTVMRWLGDARVAIGDNVRRLLEARLRLSPSEFEGIVPIVRSQLDLSISRCFADGSQLTGT